jgi:hypothetical protein
MTDIEDIEDDEDDEWVPTDTIKRVMESYQDVAYAYNFILPRWKTPNDSLPQVILLLDGPSNPANLEAVFITRMLEKAFGADVRSYAISIQRMVPGEEFFPQKLAVIRWGPCTTS